MALFSLTVSHSVVKLDPIRNPCRPERKEMLSFKNVSVIMMLRRVDRATGYFARLRIYNKELLSISPTRLSPKFASSF